MQTFKILMPYFKRYKKDVFAAFVAIIVSAFATLYQPRLLENINVQSWLIKDNQSFATGLS